MWIQISAGRGPLECQRGVYLFTQKYLLSLLAEHHASAKILKEIPGEKPGTLFSVILSVDLEKNENAEKAIKTIEGSVKWICLSPYRPKHKRKNWFINVEVFEIPKELFFDEKDVEFQRTRSSGPGGQNVNKVETAVRAVHVPSRITVLASEERTQVQNKKLALARLHRILKNQAEANKESHKKELWSQHNDLVRGNAVLVFKGTDFKKV